MTKRRKQLIALLSAVLVAGCQEREKPYGVERTLSLPGTRRQIWAVAPVENLSGEKEIDPLLQADLVYGQLQQVEGLTVIPVNRVAEVYASLRLTKVQSEQQAALVCDLLGCDALVVTTVTLYDPYNPPKIGASMQVFGRPNSFQRTSSLSPRDLARQATPGITESMERDGNFLQAVGVFDAANGSVRQLALDYARGRQDPAGPMAEKEYFASSERYSGFVYHTLIAEILKRLSMNR